MPRFNISSSMDLIDPLKDLGIQSMFGGRADLSGITGTPGLYVDSAIQKAVLEVNERGSRASAATGLGISRGMIMLNPRLDLSHPFMFVIRDVTNKMNLFVGRFSDPRSQ
ncbi:hypothetical protein LOTGIDRAFT_129979 [Lottia gigantea]|uniref:Serpin domain-containing protein n=1 Tax=Lottia gigantea TaxID=225164 RepID=V3Z5K5_LOTGI|nr:hypothetical protein LOTGIDRAFT_129979 [Lottia gigantea]ESO86043.1 hypothetical protein LOTGIDRAFT_129979 [Lottia gigantea]